MNPLTFVHRPPESAVCGQCGIIGLPAEMHRASLPVAGTLPTLPNEVTWRCRDEAACVARIAHKHRNDALKTSDDPLYAAGNVLDRLRGDLLRTADDLSAVQDCLGRARVQYLQEPTESMVERAARTIAVLIAGEEQYAEDPRYHEAARAALKAALYDAEEPLPPPPTPEVVVRVAGILWPDQERAYEDPAKHVQVQRIIRTVRDADAQELGAEPDGVHTRFVAAQEAYAAYRREHPEEPCIEWRYNERGDCDGPLLEVELIKPNEFNRAIGQSGKRVSICDAHWRQAYRVGEVGQR